MNRNSILIVLLVLGMAVSAYTAYVHYNPGALVCPQGKIINCSGVLSSGYSIIFGIPLGAYSALWFLVALLLFLYKKAKTIAELWFLIGIGGILYSAFSMYKLGEICIYCSTLDVLIAASIVLFFKQKAFARTLPCPMASNCMFSIKSI